jgi:hypothetical protein
MTHDTKVYPTLLHTFPIKFLYYCLQTLLKVSGERETGGKPKTQTTKIQLIRVYLTCRQTQLLCLTAYKIHT